MTEKSENPADWSRAARDGARRKGLRRWAKLPLERVIAAFEEMQVLNDTLRAADTSAAQPHPTASVQESHSIYGSENNDLSTADKIAAGAVKPRKGQDTVRRIVSGPCLGIERRIRAAYLIVWPLSDHP